MFKSHVSDGTVNGNSNSDFFLKSLRVPAKQEFLSAKIITVDFNIFNKELMKRNCRIDI